MPIATKSLFEGGGNNGQSRPSLPAQPAPPVNIPEPLPFMAQENRQVDTIIGTKGSEPIYYSGKPRDGWTGIYDSMIGDPLKNWGRRTFANIFDPYKVLPSPTQDEEKKIAERKASFMELIKGQGRFVDTPLEKIAKAGANVAEFFGVSPEELATGFSTLDVAGQGPQGCVGERPQARRASCVVGRIAA